MKRIKVDWPAELKIEEWKTHTLAQMADIVRGNRCYRHISLAEVQEIGAGKRLVNPCIFLTRLENAHGAKCWFCDDAGSFPTPATYFEHDAGVMVCCAGCRHDAYLRSGMWGRMLRRRFDLNPMENGIGKEPGGGDWFKTYAVLRALTDLTSGAKLLNNGIRAFGAN